MFKVDDESKKITMNEGDFGLMLTFTFDEIQTGSKFELKIYNKDETILEKTIIDVDEKEVNLSLTEEETKKIKEGVYYWSFLQYIEETLHNTIIKDRVFKVEAGA